MGERDRRPRVVFVHLGRGLGGSSQALLTLLRHLDDVEDGVERWLYAPPGVVLTTVRREGLAERCIEMPWRDQRRGLGRIEAARQLRRIVVETPVDVLHANGFSELNICLPAARRKNLPVAMWSHASRASPTAGSFASLWRSERRRVAWLAVSDAGADVLAGALRLERSLIEVVGNPIDLDRVVAPERVTDVEGGLRIAYLGQALEVKGWRLLPELIRRGRPDWRWTLYANRPDPLAQPEDAAVHAELLALATDHAVELPGRTATVSRAYANADVVLVPSFAESFSRVVVEAMANGIPVVASDLDVHRDLLGDEEAGLLVASGDVDAFGHALQRLADDAALRERLGVTGRQRAARHGPEAPAARLRSIYRELAQRPSR